MSAEGHAAGRRHAEARLERWLGITLRTGVILATTLLALGLFLELAGMADGVAGRLSHVGLLVLMATPVARVVISVAEYAAERDWPFLTLTLIVLTILLVSFFLGI